MDKKRVKKNATFFDVTDLYIAKNNLSGNFEGVFDGIEYGYYPYRRPNTEESKQMLNRAVFVGGVK